MTGQDGFFSMSELTQVRKPLPMLAKCGECGLFKTCQSPKMKVWGKGKKKVMIVGEAPGFHEDKEGRPFVGKTGHMLREKLRQNGFDPDRDCVMTNALICRPPDDRIPKGNMIDFCRPNVLKVMKEHEPVVVILLGKSAVKSVIGHLWKEDVGLMDRWAGWQIPSQRYNCWVCPMNHPSYLMREESVVLNRLFDRQLESALSHSERPWVKIPDYKSNVQVLFDVREAAKIIRTMAKGARPVAFDYETSCLKPDDESSQIVCCSVSDGKTTIAYPWDKDAIDATRELIRSNVPKIASNMKFEERWTRCKLKTRVRNWKWDTMLAAHVLDNRPLITSIKFQSFVRLGQESYDDHIKPYLQSKEQGGYAVNRIKQLDTADLMLYCGLDSVLEWKVAKLQMKEMYGQS